MNAQDTIAAIATGASDAGIGIIRISGENAFGAARIFRILPRTPFTSVIFLRTEKSLMKCCSR